MTFTLDNLKGCLASYRKTANSFRTMKLATLNTSPQILHYAVINSMAPTVLLILIHLPHYDKHRLKAIIGF